MKRKRLLMDIVLILLVIVSGVMLFKGKKDPKLDDYNYFWETVEDGYPFYTFLNEDNRLEKVKEKYKKEVKELDYKNSEEVVEFYNKIISEITEDKSVGHFRAMNKGMYLSWLDDYYWFNNIEKMSSDEKISYFAKLTGEKISYEEIENMMSKERENYNMIGSKKPQSFYKLTEEDKKIAEKNAKKRLGENISRNNIEMEIESNFNIEKSIYLKLDSFDVSGKDENYYNNILDFIKKNISKENLIIDIRDNGGGNSEYWMNIMKYLVRGEEKYISKTLFKENKILEKYYKISKEKKKQIKDLDNNDEIKKKYEEDFDYLVERVSTSLKPVGDESIFNGKIWVLVNGNVYSAATEFMDFCNSIEYITTVGTNGGGGMNSGDALLQLPNCGMLYRFDLSVALNDDLLPTDIYGVAPDIYTEEDALEYVKNLINK